MAKFEWNEWLLLWLLELEFFEFQWDDGNRTKNQEKHGITCEEAESVFKNKDKIRVLGLQTSPIANEIRYGILGTTNTIKSEHCVRIISIREMNRKEITLYEKLCEE